MFPFSKLGTQLCTRETLQEMRALPYAYSQQGAQGRSFIMALQGWPLPCSPGPCPAISPPAPSSFLTTRPRADGRPGNAQIIWAVCRSLRSDRLWDAPLWPSSTGHSLVFICKPGAKPPFILLPGESVVSYPLHPDMACLCHVSHGQVLLSPPGTALVLTCNSCSAVSVSTDWCSQARRLSTAKS